jgi:hypothetical protein
MKDEKMTNFMILGFTIEFTSLTKEMIESNPIWCIGKIIDNDDFPAEDVFKLTIPLWETLIKLNYIPEVWIEHHIIKDIYSGESKTKKEWFKSNKEYYLKVIEMSDESSETEKDLIKRYGPTKQQKITSKKIIY